MTGAERMPEWVITDARGYISGVTGMISLNRPEGVRAEYIKIPASGKKLKLLILRPGAAEGERPGVLWIHGGGYVTGMPEMAYMTRAVDLVNLGGAVVVSPAYTLSLRRPYPAALLDCHSALCYMKDHAKALGIRPDQLMVGGESAGGGLAAALCMYAKDKGSVNIAFQMPLYPMLDCYDTESSRDNHEKMWDTRRNHLAWKLYLRDLKDKGEIPAYASPSRREDLSGLPPCYTFVGDIEPFRDETLEYVRRLRAAGVPAEVDVYPGFYHAYDAMHPERADAKRASERFIDRFKAACALYRAEQNTQK